MNERARWNDVLQTMPDETLRIRRAAFRELLGSGRPVPIQQTALDAGLEPDRGRHAARLVASVGMAEVIDDHIVGMDGLTTRETTHRLLIDDVALWTWCAYDIVGIAAAPRRRGRNDGVRILRRGHVRRHSRGATGREFGGGLGAQRQLLERHGRVCPSALLFCSRSHLDEWRKTRPDEAGQALDLESLAELGRLNWAPLVDAEAA